jgi:hypothetical protein
MADNVEELMKELTAAVADVSAKKRESEEATKKAQAAATAFSDAGTKARDLQNRFNNLVNSQLNPTDSRVNQSA